MLTVSPGKHFFRHVGTEPPLPGYYQHFFYFIFSGGGGEGGKYERLSCNSGAVCCFKVWMSLY